MPPCPADLEAWWLGPGLPSLVHLVDATELPVTPKQCGFPQAVQQRLRAFDNSQELVGSLADAMADLAAEKAFSHDFNPRKKMHEAMRCIFRRQEDGGIDSDRALEGLEYLDAMEMHRQRLLKATSIASEVSPPDAQQSQLINELHRQATFHYRQLHMGLRASMVFTTVVLMEEFDQPRPRPPATTMARLNALFPASTILVGDDDMPVAPYSVGLRDSIRFSVFEHVMNQRAAAHRDIRMKLFCWCDMPGYNQAREALMKYSEEAKKIEEACLETLSAIERRCSAHAYAPPMPNPLLRGLPGRELSAAATDTAALAGDVDAPPVLAYPDNLSSTHFHQHPLAKDLEWNSRTQAEHGLIVPSQVASRNF
ncbi:hypothetical protein GQ602_003129 [Ophiocordyceps camponoti-floridani]|uniref:Uncharacterized protein n=1 Tax=Ophiocordyceps camponoti-floridani TaxID=2030778 RepID=A0A8H4Q7M3_9HYPO|nr:hypothetical protein GQ602_003129 [Ophiocordyceps camponoti-floridani]